MRISRTGIFLFFLWPCIYLHPQERQDYVDIQIGWGSYAMEGLSEFDEYLTRLNPIDVENNADYPAYLYYQVGYLWDWPGYAFGFGLEHRSTGSRYSMSDITGIYVYDSRISSNAVAMYFRFHLLHGSSVRLAFNLEGGLSNSSLKIDEHLQLAGEDIMNDNYRFRSLEYYMEPGLSLGYRASFWEVSVLAGYSLQLGGTGFRTRIDGQVGELRYENKPVKADWSGFRLGVGIGFNLRELFQLF